MTAREVIDHIKTMPPQERAKVIDFVQEIIAKEPPVKYADNAAFTEAAKWVFNEHSELMRKLSQ
jgi:hypothetical protein